MTGAAMIGVAALWYVLPRPWRIGLTTGIFVEETITVIENRVSVGLTIRL
jgi:hypothetical protein